MSIVCFGHRHPLEPDFFLPTEVFCQKQQDWLEVKLPGNRTTATWTWTWACCLLQCWIYDSSLLSGDTVQSQGLQAQSLLKKKGRTCELI